VSKAPEAAQSNQISMRLLPN